MVTVVMHLGFIKRYPRIWQTRTGIALSHLDCSQLERGAAMQDKSGYQNDNSGYQNDKPGYQNRLAITTAPRGRRPAP